MIDIKSPVDEGSLTEGSARALLLAEVFERAAYYAIRLQLTIYVVSRAGDSGNAASDVGNALLILVVSETVVPILLTQVLQVQHSVRSAITFLALRVVALLGLALAPQWADLPLIGVLGASAGGYRAGHASAFSRELDKWRGDRSRTRGWSAAYVVGNVGFIFGASMGSWVRRVSWELLWSMSAALLLVAVGFMLLVGQRGHDSGPAPPCSVRPKTGERPQFPIFAFLAVQSGLASYYVCYNSVFDFLPARLNALAGATGLRSPFEAELLVLANPILVLLLAPLLSRVLAGKLAVPLALGTMLTAGGVLLCAVTISLPVILGGVLLFTIGELLVSPRRFQFLLQVMGSHQRSTAVSCALLPALGGWWVASVVLLPAAIRQDLTSGLVLPVAWGAGIIGAFAALAFFGFALVPWCTNRAGGSR